MQTAAAILGIKRIECMYCSKPLGYIKETCITQKLNKLGALKRTYVGMMCRACSQSKCKISRHHFITSIYNRKYWLVYRSI